MREAWDRKAELVEELYAELFEEGGGYVRKKGFKVRANTLEIKPAEVRICDTYVDRYMQQLPLDVTIGNRGTKANSDCFQLGQVRKWSEQIVWMGICGWVDPYKCEFDKANGT